MPETGAPLPSGLLVVLLTDIEGSMRRWESAYDDMRAALAQHDSILRSEILKQGGHIFKTAGDAFFCVLSDPSGAIGAAVAAQARLSETNCGDLGSLAVRMAIHAGPVEAREGDYFGSGVNRCARLLAVAHGGQVLVSGALADMLQGQLASGVTLHALGRYRLKDVPEEQSLYQLVAPGLRSIFPALRVDASKAHNLPQPLSSFIRRDKCLKEIRGRMRTHRIVSLVGSGGVGKTRMALEVAADLLKESIDGLWYVELAGIDSSPLVAETLCSTIGLPVGGGVSATDSAIGYLSGKRVVLIFDNCEHLIDATAALSAALVRSCPSVSILATSRERLGIMGESSYRIPGLSVPPPAGPVSARAALKHEAVQLFVDRAAAALDDFELTDANAMTIVNICQQLNGMPIAIELVVPQLRMLKPDHLASRLRERLLVVKGGRNDLPRHQTLNAVFDWSYNLLDESERALFRELSVFSGGWTLEAATAVAAGPAVADGDVYDVLTSLVDKSLVVVDVAGTEPRYDFLQPVRQYAARKKQAAGPTGARSRLTRYMLDLFARSSANWSTTPTARWIGLYEPDLDNLRAALDWAFGPDGDKGLGVELASYGIRIWDELSLLAERDRYLGAAFENLGPATTPDTSSRLWLGRISDSAHGDETNFDRAMRAASFCREVRDSRGTGEALAKAGAALLTPETTAQAEPYLQEAAALLRPLGPTKQLASCLRSLAVSRYFTLDFDGARPLMAQSEAVARQVGDARGHAAVQIAASELEFAAGAPEAAVAATGAMLAQGDCSRRQRVLGSCNLASYLLALDRVDEARKTALASLSEAQSLGWKAAMVRAVEHLALAAALRGKPEAAARMLGYTTEFYRNATATREHTEKATFLRLGASLEAALPSHKRDALMAEGASWTHERAAAEVEDLDVTGFDPRRPSWPG